MDKFLNSIWSKIMRIVLAAAVVVMGIIPGSFIKEVPITVDGRATGEIQSIVTNYFAFDTSGIQGWAPMVCGLLCVLALICAVICFFKETENTLTLLANMLCMGLAVNLLMQIFLKPTVLGWCIAALLIADLIITAMQEMKLEDAKKSK